MRFISVRAEPVEAQFELPLPFDKLRANGGAKYRANGGAKYRGNGGERLRTSRFGVSR